MEGPRHHTSRGMQPSGLSHVPGSGRQELLSGGGSGRAWGGRRRPGRHQVWQPRCWPAGRTI